MAGGFATGVAAVVISAVKGDFGLDALLGLLLGWSFVASGMVAWARRPENDLGVLMASVGLVWFSAALLKTWHAPVPFTAGIWLGDVWLVPLAFLLAGFPTLRVEGAPARAAVAGLVLVMGPLELAWLMCLNFDRFGGPGPANAVMAWDAPEVASGIDTAQRAIAIGSLLTLAVLLVQRWRRARGPLRRVLHPVLAGAVAVALLASSYLIDKLGGRPDAVMRLALLVLAAVPLIFLAGLLRARLARSGVGELLVELREPSEPGALRDALAKALRDPSLELAYWVPEYRTYVDSAGHPVTLGDRATTFVERGGTQVAALLHDPTLKDEPELVGAVASAAGIALENERLQADLRARLSDLKASRARIVEAGDAARRKLERDLHDGAQQRLVSLSVVLRVVANRIEPGTTEARLLHGARTELNASLEELRHLARGIHPAILSDHGLEVALESLAARASVRTTLDVRLEERPPIAAEVAAYYLLAEGLTNVTKYAEATSASVHVAREGGVLVVEVADDGKGGADPACGSGLRGLADRVEALDGRLQLWSPPAGGTRLRAEIPCA
jgi:signal transduction histidine kinase